KQYGVPRSTLRDRLFQIHGAASTAHEGQQLLNRDEEQALVDWAEHLSDQGRPLSKRTLVAKVKKLCGIRPSKKWYHRFLLRHPE
ncbi:hypothetical protein BV25DRAFT_1765199, partial [Artomyces pyxidatus]